ncbi:DUF2974 domain-containing protein [Carnobacteriaceae bacterium zg-ZUI78]|nr:DUF2974 domain-containing protein [Carnobacteriaceae bacterium zg-ZUI78]
MATLFDYLHWRGDLSFRQSRFNVVDSMILTRFSYLPFDNIVNDFPQTIQQIGEHFFGVNRQNDPNIIMSKDNTLLETLMHTKRFSKLLVQHYQNTVDVEQEQQFSAMMFQLDSRTTYVVFRGTDMTLVGWKEDFNMTFENAIPSQIEAVSYLTKHQSDIKERLILGGHSKGGNLAIYAGAFAPQDIRQKIVYIHNFDGPGFNEQMSTDEAFGPIQKKIKTFVPETAIVGMMLNHNTPYDIVKSSATNVLQHDTYSWEIERNDFIYLEKRDATSKHIQRSVSALLTRLSTEERKTLGNAIYQMMLSANITDVRDFSVNTPHKLLKMMKAYGELDKETSKLITETIQLFVKSITKDVLKKKE